MVCELEKDRMYTQCCFECCKLPAGDDVVTFNVCAGCYDESLAPKECKYCGETGSGTAGVLDWNEFSHYVGFHMCGKCNKKRCGLWCRRVMYDERNPGVFECAKCYQSTQ